MWGAASLRRVTWRTTRREPSGHGPFGYRVTRKRTEPEYDRTRVTVSRPLPSRFRAASEPLPGRFQAARPDTPGPARSRPRDPIVPCQAVDACATVPRRTPW
ncbi:predicted protein [Streptomyces sp. C]|nr:predicted protein [Streptomyces sp. C]